VVVNPAFTVSAAQSNVVLNVVDALKVTVAGTATLNGAVPATSYCSSSYIRARVKFTHASNSHYDTTVDVGNCVATSDAYAWTTGLRPGTYSVSVSGGNYSALPSWEVVVNPAFIVSGAQSNVVLNVTDALKVTVSGTVTLNGSVPATSYCSSSYIRARVKFTHESNSHYDTTVDIGNCVSTSDTYSWTAQLRPGTYSVIVSGGNYSALPSWEITVADRLVVR
jgi:protein involved in polysaccharide export with SLBB domain